MSRLEIRTYLGLAYGVYTTYVGGVSVSEGP